MTMFEGQVMLGGAPEPTPVIMKLHREQLVAASQTRIVAEVLPIGSTVPGNGD
jgi:hypothetical protein